MILTVCSVWRVRAARRRRSTNAFASRRRLPTLLDETALEHETIYVSAGRRGLEIELAPRDLLALTGGTARRLT